MFVFFFLFILILLPLLLLHSRHFYVTRVSSRLLCVSPFIVSCEWNFLEYFSMSTLFLSCVCHFLTYHSFCPFFPYFRFLHASIRPWICFICCGFVVFTHLFSWRTLFASFLFSLTSTKVSVYHKLSLHIHSLSFIYSFSFNMAFSSHRFYFQLASFFFLSFLLQGGNYEICSFFLIIFLSAF